MSYDELLRRYGGIQALSLLMTLEKLGEISGQNTDKSEEKRYELAIEAIDAVYKKRAG